MSEWLPIETAPEHGKILLCRKVKNPYRWPDAPNVRLKPPVFVGSKRTVASFPGEFATHWQPLPEPPK